MARTDTLTNYLTDVATAIKTKTGSQTPIQASAFDTAIANIPTGGGVEESDVNYYDYDGTLLHSYTKTEFLALTEHPANPSHSGLTAQGWNWDLTEAKTFVNNFGMIDIGQMYITDDGKTRAYVNIPDNLTITNNIWLSSGSTCVLDWGDNTTPDTLTASSDGVISTTHTYANKGDYVITFNITGRGGFNYSSASNLLFDYVSILKKLEMGNNFFLGTNGLRNNYNLETITVSNDGTANNSSSHEYTFNNCYGLKFFIAPKYSSGNFVLGTSCFYNDYSLENVVFSNNTYAIGLQQTPFTNTGLKKSISPVEIQDSGLENLKYLEKVIYGPSSITATLGSSMYSGCFNLKLAKVNAREIISNGFYNCKTLEKVEFTATNLMLIGATTFKFCNSLKVVDFTKTTTIPTLDNISAFNNTNDYYKIVVPDNLYASWITTNNWSDSSIVGHIVKASEYTE